MFGLIIDLDYDIRHPGFSSAELAQTYTTPGHHIDFNPRTLENIWPQALKIQDLIDRTADIPDYISISSYLGGLRNTREPIITGMETLLFSAIVNCIKNRRQVLFFVPGRLRELDDNDNEPTVLFGQSSRWLYESSTFCMVRKRGQFNLVRDIRHDYCGRVENIHAFLTEKFRRNPV